MQSFQFTGELSKLSPELEQALQGDLPDAVKKATVDAMKSYNDLARALLKDQQNMEAFLSLIYDLMKNDIARELIA